MCSLTIEAGWLDHFRAAAHARGIHWWPLWCACSFGTRPLPPWYREIAQEIGYPVEDVPCG
jgi:hypothetical protein